MVTVSEDFFEAMGVDPDTYQPIRTEPFEGGSSLALATVGWDYLHMDDPELACLNLATAQDLPPFKQYHFLNARVSKEDIEFRQEAVIELYENPELYTNLMGFFAELGSAVGIYNTREYDGRLKVEACVWDMMEIVDKLKGLDVKSHALKRCVQWAEELDQDSVWQEQVRTNRKITNSRIAAFFSERHKGVVYGIAKPGTCIEDHFDIFDTEMLQHEWPKPTKKNPYATEKRNVVKYQSPGDKEAIEYAVGHARQRMDELNQISAWMMTLPMTMMLAQLRHYLQGTHLLKKWDEWGVPAVFPKIREDGVIKIRDFYPLNCLHTGKNDVSHYVPNDLDLNAEDRLVMVQGANNRGKSEAWRSMHIMAHLANAGFAVPANVCEWSITPASEWIQCKGGEFHGGSEFGHSVKGMMKQLANVHPGQTVFLDELGDVTNGPTGVMQVERSIPVLLGRGCRVFVTTHSDSVADRLQEMGAKCFMPGDEKFKLVLKEGEIDYCAEEVLDEMGFTTEKLEDLMPTEPLDRKFRKVKNVSPRGIDDDYMDRFNPDF